MADYKHTISEIESAFSDLGFPTDFLSAYDQMECLANHKGRETFLVRDKKSGTFAVAKCYDKTFYALSPETDLLKKLDHAGLPEWIGRYENEKMLCIVREYIDGISLDSYSKENDLSQSKVIGICEKLADILAYLHTQTPPIIHRDIKPENIIVKPNGDIALIDFDIARTVKVDAESDTLFFGTKGYAPPEQYGFTQTDQRADIYAFGVLLRYLLTGNSRPKKNIYVQGDLQRVIDKCTAFSPKDRYADMLSVKRAMRYAHKAKKPTRKCQLAIVTAFVVLSLILGFCVGRYTSLFAPDETKLSFAEPMIETAVRTQLGLSERDKLTEKDLLSVKHLYIFGTKAYREQQDYFNNSIDQNTRGVIASLDDLKMLPNLEELFIAYQGMVDISAVRELRNLCSVEFKHMDIGSAEPLAELPRLRNVGLFDSGISSAKELEACSHLESLDIGRTDIRSMEQVGIHPELKTITLKWLKMDTLDGIERMPHLLTVFVDAAEIEDMSALLRLPELERVYAGERNIEAVTALLHDTDVEVLLP